MDIIWIYHFKPKHIFDVIIEEQLMNFFINYFNNIWCDYRKQYGCEPILWR